MFLYNISTKNETHTICVLYYMYLCTFICTYVPVYVPMYVPMYLCTYRQWRFTEVSMKLLAMLIRHDVLYPLKGVQLLVNSLVHDALNIRKVCVCVCVYDAMFVCYPVTVYHYHHWIIFKMRLLSQC